MNSQNEESGEDRRADIRYAFGAVQQIAEIVDDTLPTLDAFEQIRCIDISRGGFSFYRKTVPEQESVVVALGSPPDCKYLSARIVQAIKQEEMNNEVYRVCCQFTGRLQLRGETLVAQQDDEQAAAMLAGAEGGKSD